MHTLLFSADTTMGWWPRMCIELADTPDAQAAIFRARHAVYARELGQYQSTPTGMLEEDASNYMYVQVKKGGRLCGFIAITPPGQRKAMERHGVVPSADSYELRILTVLPGFRRRGVARALMYGAMRLVEASGGNRIEALAHRDVMAMYLSRGMETTGTVVTVGQVTYEHVRGEVDRMRTHDHKFTPGTLVWALPFAPTSPLPCVHGGRGLDALDPKGIHADVLDAWFPPAPSVVRGMSDHAAADARTTPPATPSQLLHALCESRGLPASSFVLGAGSSDLIYRCFWAWLTPASRVLLLSPTYAEYEHVARSIGCHVTSWRVDDMFCVDPRIPEGRYDLVVLTNPNSPTGILCSTVARLVERFDASTRIWVDETYIDYAGACHSVEHLTAKHTNLVVCKSMSKAYALSGVRVGYICAHPWQLEPIRCRTPPWIVSRVAQRAAVSALASADYYRARYDETHVLREQLGSGLEELGWTVVRGSTANFVLGTPPREVSAQDMVDGCAAWGVYLRRIDDFVRVAVKDADTQSRMLDVVAYVTSRHKDGSVPHQGLHSLGATTRV